MCFVGGSHGFKKESASQAQPQSVFASRFCQRIKENVGLLTMYLLFLIEWFFFNCAI